MESIQTTNLLINALVFGLAFALAFGIIAAIKEKKNSDKNKP
jgi:ABC-type dipeptide/oligopeptide/nickel transport system permease component